MDILNTLTAYIHWNAIVAAGCVVALLFSRALTQRYRASGQRRLHYSLLAVVIAAPLFSYLAPAPQWNSPAEIWATPEQRSPTPKVQIEVAATPVGKPFSKNHAGTALFALLGIAFLVRFFILGKAAFQLRRIRKNSLLFRRIGRLEIWVSDSIATPFAYWSVKRSHIFLPETFLTDPENLRMALRHEGEHHRAKDTFVLHLLEIGSVLFFANPFYSVWKKRIQELQEFACDESLVHDRKISAQAYGRCLIQVAELTLGRRSLLAGTTGMASESQGNLLKRIKAMKQQRQEGRRVGFALTTLGTLLIGTFAIASQGYVEDRRISKADAERWAEKANRTAGLQIDMNNQVLHWLKQYGGTKSGRLTMNRGIERMKTHTSLLDEAFTRHKIPRSLAAIGIIESGFQNLHRNKNRGTRAAGIWQFIRRTAQRFGLRVDRDPNGVDDRLDVRKSTIAAVSYLGKLNVLFQDWRLATLSYNAGENAVKKAIMETGSRDPWKVIKSKHISQESRNYIGKVMAAIILLKNPEVLA